MAVTDDAWMLVVDIDSTLVDHQVKPDLANLRLRELWKRHKKKCPNSKFVLASGRKHWSILDMVESGAVPMEIVDAVLSSTGARLRIGGELHADYPSSVAHPTWKAENVIRIVNDIEGLRLQDSKYQCEYRVGVFANNKVKETAEPLLQAALTEAGIAHSLIFSHDAYLDIMPPEVNKGRGVVYLRELWGIPETRTVVCGDSGNDIALFARGVGLGVLVGNALHELRAWVASERGGECFQATARCSGGIIEGCLHYSLFTPEDLAAVP